MSSSSAGSCEVELQPTRARPHTAAIVSATRLNLMFTRSLPFTKRRRVLTAAPFQNVDGCLGLLFRQSLDLEAQQSQQFTRSAVAFKGVFPALARAVHIAQREQHVTAAI